jgi:hypothetical protein
METQGAWQRATGGFGCFKPSVGEQVVRSAHLNNRPGGQGHHYRQSGSPAFHGMRPLAGFFFKPTFPICSEPEDDPGSSWQLM